jgi:murein DD-endopeptidase MepM/ murein hydrolase activator NlpD
VAEGGLERAVVGGGFDPAILRVMREAMTGHASLDELGRGVRVRVIAQEVTALGEFSRYAGIEALEVSFPSDRKPLRIYFFNGPKSRGYYDETGKAPYEGGWRNPIPNAPVTSKFNMKRMHPVLHKIMPHTGTDFGASMGTPVGASSFGTISFMGWGGPSGNLVKVQHADDIETGYAHLQRFAEGLKVGDKVARLQTVGYCGSTGRSTGPHLHFTVKRKGAFIDPLSLKLDALRVLPSDERAVFMEHKAQYDAKLDAIVLPALPNTKLPEAPATPIPEGEEEESGSAVAENKSDPTAPPVAPATPMPSVAGPSLYLTDDELRKQQKAADDGEVDE